MTQDTAVCQAKVSAPHVKSELVLNELNGLSSVPVITAVPGAKVEQSESNWKHLEAEDWRSWKEEVSEPVAAASLLGDDYAVCKSTETTEPVAAVSTDQAVCDRLKTEQPLNYSTVCTSSTSVSDVRTDSQVIASVVPCQQSNDAQLSAWKVPLPSHPPPPPPLLHSTNQPSTSPLPTSVIRSPVIVSDELSMLLPQNDSSDSEQEPRNLTPSPELRLINEECHRSKHAMYDIASLFLFCVFVNLDHLPRLF